MAGTTVTIRQQYADGTQVDQQRLSLNALVTSLTTALTNLQGTGVVTASTLARGTTVTLAATANTIAVAGVPGAIAAETAKAFGALGTIPASKWGVIAVERVLAATTTFVSGAANYTTGYATEALAIAALPAITANKVRVGYVTVLASGSGWVAGTDALAGGTGGTPATTTNYYSDPSMYGTAAHTGYVISTYDG